MVWYGGGRVLAPAENLRLLKGFLFLKCCQLNEISLSKNGPQSSFADDFSPVILHFCGSFHVYLSVTAMDCMSCEIL